MSIPIPGILYRGNHIPTFALQNRQYIDKRKLSNYGINKSEELMNKAYRFFKFIRNNGKYTKQILDSYKQELKVIETECVNESVFREEKSKARY